jgi:hypothetical protein
MPRIELTIASDMFDKDQDASIRENLPVRTLITEIRREFQMPDDAMYSLRVQSTGKVLDPEKTLEQQNVSSGAILIFNRERRAAVREAVVGVGARNPIPGPLRPFVREDSSGAIFEIQFSPAIIGRPDPTNPESTDLLAVNVGPFDSAKSVSRYHARVSEDDGEYFLESLADHNPAYLNDSIVRMGEKRLLMQGDKIRVGKISLTFGVRVQTGNMSRPMPEQN